MQGKKLTITIPTWNRARLLEELLSELISQIKADNIQDRVEVLISNNGSTDDTEEIVNKFSASNNFITYSNNGTNMGARYNVLRCMEISNGEYLILFGDDDRPSNGSLKKVIDFLDNHPNTGTLYDSAIFRTNPFGDSKLNLEQLLENFYYYLGNAGVFIIKSQFVKDVLNKYKYDYFSPTWPQTQIFILASEENIDSEIYISKLNILSAGKHEEVMIYTSYYLWRTTYYDLIAAVNDLKNEISSSSRNASKTYFKRNVGQLFFNILQIGIFLDDGITRRKTAKHIFGTLKEFGLKEKILLFIAACALIIPSFISRFLSNIFIYLTRGSRGMKKKNDFIQKEKEKRDRKRKSTTNSIREFDFENV